MVSKKAMFSFNEDKSLNLFKKKKQERHTYPKLKSDVELRNSPIRLLYKKPSVTKTPLQLFTNPLVYLRKSPVCNLNKIFEKMDRNEPEAKPNEGYSYETLISSPSVIQRSKTK